MDGHLGRGRHAFTRPGFGIFVDLVDGWALTTGRRTVTRIIGVIDAEGRRAHDAYHRLIRDGAWKMTALWQTLAVRIVEQLCPCGQPVAIDLDDTLLHKSGRRIDGAGVFRDAVRATRNRVVHALGLNLVVVTVRVTPPWGGMPVGLPVNARVRRKDRDATTVDLARDMLEHLARWLPDRTFHAPRRSHRGGAHRSRSRSRRAATHARRASTPAAASTSSLLAGRAVAAEARLHRRDVFGPQRHDARTSTPR